MSQRHMAVPLTYPPEIVIESTVDLPPEFGPPAGFELTEAHLELGLFLIEFVFELLARL
jgi:hypothetical protein